MRLQNPSGLWLLLGVPVLVLIWLIRPQHENRRVSSSYLWRLSDRFMKRKLPLSLFERWLVFALQLLLVTGGALLAARPVLVRENQVDYLLILDASGSMQTKTESGMTRYGEAVEQILALSGEVRRGHTVSVITAGRQARTLLSASSSEKEIADALASAPCEWGKSSLSGAMTLAQLFCAVHPAAKVILYTDREAEEAENLTVISLDGGEWNASLTDFGVIRDDAGGCVLEASLTSWGKDERIAAGLSIDGRLREAVNCDCPADTPVKVRFSVEDTSEIRYASIAIDPGDALEADNRIDYWPDNERPCDILLCSETPFYLSAALSALDRGRLTLTADPSSAGDYDLYVYDGTLPETLPPAGAVLLVNPDRMPEGITAKETAEEALPLAASAVRSEFQDLLLRGMELSGVTAAKHIAADASDDWTTVCSLGGDPVLLARREENGCAVAVLLFDLHDSNLPLRTDFLHLLRNVVNLAVPALLEQRVLEVGETQRVTLPPNTAALRITAPDGSLLTLEGEGVHVFETDLPGSFTAETEEEATGFSVLLPEEESRPGSALSLSLIPGEAEEEAPPPAAAGLWRILAALMLLLLLAEWGIYIHEQL